MKYARVTQAAPQGGSWAYSPARQAKCGGKRDSKGRIAGEHERERADIRSNEELQAAWHCVCHGVGRVLRTLHNVSHAGTDAGHMAAMARGARSTVALHRDVCYGRTRSWFKRPVQRSMVACRMCKIRPDSDLAKTVATKPGWVMMASAAIGGPFAATCYVMALNAGTQAGNPGVIVPIAALNVTVGAILGRVMFKQRHNG